MKDSSIYMSDSIADKVDTRQFYESPDLSDKIISVIACSIETTSDRYLIDLISFEKTTDKVESTITLTFDSEATLLADLMNPKNILQATLLHGDREMLNISGDKISEIKNLKGLSIGINLYRVELTMLLLKESNN